MTRATHITVIVIAAADTIVAPLMPGKKKKKKKQAVCPRRRVEHMGIVTTSAYRGSPVNICAGRRFRRGRGKALLDSRTLTIR